MSAAAQLAPAESVSTSQDGKPRVLVVDDNLGLAEIWSFVLEDAGCDVTTASSGGDALGHFAHETYDAAVLDLQLPDLSGLDVFAALRADTPEIEGILVTGHASTESAIEATNRGLYGYLVKPVAPEMLRVQVERALERKRIQAENRTMLAHLSALQGVLDTALESVGLADVLRRTLQSVVTAMDVDSATLLLLDADGCLVATAAYPSQDEGHGRFRLKPGDGFAGRIFATRESLQLQDVQTSSLVQNPAIKASGTESLLGVPVLSSTGAIGVLHIGSHRARVFGDRELRLLEAIAQRVSLAVEKWQLMGEREEHLREVEKAYRRERHIAETLQRSLLPDLHVDIAGLTIGYLYQAAMAEAEVGGDFYDVVELSNGLVGVVMGDVSGKGLDAAVYTALTKYTLRSYALEDPDPGRVMGRLNRAFAQQSSDETFATLFYCVIDLVPGRLAYASAGHEPALLHRSHLGQTEWLRPTGPAAGVLVDAEYETKEVEFANHDALFLYTDGASDARRDNQWLGTQGLQELLEKNMQPDVHDTIAGIYDGILHFARNALRDDTALLLLRRKPEEIHR